MLEDRAAARGVLHVRGCANRGFVGQGRFARAGALLLPAGSALCGVGGFCKIWRCWRAKPSVLWSAGQATGWFKVDELPFHVPMGARCASGEKLVDHWTQAQPSLNGESGGSVRGVRRCPPRAGRSLAGFAARSSPCGDCCAAFQATHRGEGALQRAGEGLPVWPDATPSFSRSRPCARSRVLGADWRSARLRRP